jgi:excisionase family DNA binding protein
MIDPNLYQRDEELTTNQCAAAAKVDRRTIVAWIHRGELVATRRPGRRGPYRIKWHDLYDVMHTPVAPRGKTR